MFNTSKLESGLKVLSAPLDGTASVTVLVFAGAGSRYETNEERGISHFLEHMFFKGGKKYKNTKEVSAAIDGVGGDFNAFTGKEYAGYYVKVAAEHKELACDVLSDMLLNASFPPEDIERERGVIIEEERMYQDTPMYRAGWDFEELVFGDHPLGWDTIGKMEVINSVGQKDFQKHKDLLYTPDNIVVSFSGKIDEGEAMELSDKYFTGVSGSKDREFNKFDNYGSDRVFLRNKETEQAHLVLGVPGANSLGDDYFTQKLLAIILGGNMSSRMFLNIREAKGLCYYISTDDDAYLDAGSFSTRAGVDQTRLHEAIECISHEYAVCAKKGVTDEELKRSKDFLKGKITLSLEDSEEVAHFYGKQELLYPKVRTIEDYFSEIESVTKDNVNELAQKLLKPEEMRLVVIGKEKDEEKLKGLIS
ncbi:MAG: pitrilysin family protein [Candidatus Peribacteraceae bacterium]|jgi:predicted Zn-dependent peptidase|nr:pitrilysin family protein [Candidatus Peribacteraceae bacterium]MDP7454260.1 pitrilysin family protein [Candidatus Peribacteraceae bacterium]MDP7645750.1 pitrilysin family protein [Candidatus Peribacteraceae bacterium]|tara:strand:- start:1181 stop:2440 length:1260 start_codon:yes stop_codon:yes gene_type:complete